jgi:hypothetical protein
MLIDADQIEKCSDQKWHLPEFNLAPERLALGHPIQDAAGGRKIDPNQLPA